MLIFDQAYLDKLNANYEGGQFVKAVILTENPVGPVLKYFVDHEEAIVFQGNTYEPLRMSWENIKTSQGMPIEAMTLTVSNLTGKAAKYVKEIDISGNTVTLQLLHLNLLATTTKHWQRFGKILGIPNVDRNVVAFAIGRQLGRNMSPRKVFLQSEFRGLSSDVVRIL